MATVDPIKIEGLKEFIANLKKIDGELPKSARLAGNDAAQLVVDTAKPRVPRGPGRGGHAATSIKTRSTRTAVRVAEGGKRFPYMPWLDFGGRVGPNRSVRRPFKKSGRYIWAAYDEKSGEVYQRYVHGLIEVAKQSGIEVD